MVRVYIYICLVSARWGIRFEFCKNCYIDGLIRLIYSAEEFTTVQKKVYELTKDCILVGHALHHDLEVLLTQNFLFFSDVKHSSH